MSWWGTVPAATLPTTGVAFAYEGAVERFVWNLRLGLVLGTLEFLDASVLVATVQPLAPRWFVVAELEGQASASPLHLRGLARHTFGGGWTVDVGTAVPFVRIVEDPCVQVLARLERRW